MDPLSILSTSTCYRRVVYIWIYTYIHISMYTFLYLYMFLCVCVCVWCVNTYIWSSLCACVCACAQNHMSVHTWRRSAEIEQMMYNCIPDGDQRKSHTRHLAVAAVEKNLYASLWLPPKRERGGGTGWNSNITTGSGTQTESEVVGQNTHNSVLASFSICLRVCRTLINARQTRRQTERQAGRQTDRQPTSQPASQPSIQPASQPASQPARQIDKQEYIQTWS